MDAGGVGMSTLDNSGSVHPPLSDLIAYMRRRGRSFTENASTLIDSGDAAVDGHAGDKEGNASGLSLTAGGGKKETQGG
jgi:hypothetical protein